MTQGEKFIPIEKLLHSNWADETEEVAAESANNKPKNKVAWGGVSTATDDAPDLATIQAQEEAARKAEAAIKKQQPKPKPVTNPSAQSEKYSDDYRREPREPRERHPVPVDPPFTAFIGNLDYDVTEEDVQTFFTPMGVDKIRLPTKEEGGLKGFGYVEFKTAAGLEEALKHDKGIFEIFKKRPIKIDVAKPPEKAGGWGRKEGGARETREKHDTTWGPSNKESKTASGFGSGGSRPYSSRISSDQRPKLNINPPPAKAQQAESPKPRIQTENPFGAAINVDYHKMDQIAQERLEREKERERTKHEEKKRKEEQQQQQEKPKRPLSAREPHTDSWRGSPQKGTTSFSKREERDGPKTERKPRPSPVVDSEGFREQTTRSSRSTVSAAGAASGSGGSSGVAHVESPKQIHKKDEASSQQQKIDKQSKFNRYEGLGEENI